MGSFDYRKGIERLIKAVEKIDDVYIICAGKGKLIPTSKRCLYKKCVKNENLPYFYSASDIFVLPTLNEGCCNAIIEAMACGLPIISSNLSFNDDILDDTCSVRIDPTNVEEIKTAIKSLYEDKEKLYQLRKGSLKKVKLFTLEARAKKIVKFIEDKSSSE